MDNFKIIYRILHYLEQAIDCDSADPDSISAEHLNISSNRWKAIMEMLWQEKYIDGIVTLTYEEKKFVSISSPRITIRGLEYLSNNSLLQKAARTEKGIADLIP